MFFSWQTLCRGRQPIIERLFGTRQRLVREAAMLLKEFAGETPWAHLDIAGVDIYNSEKGAQVKGASGIPVRTLVQLVLDTADSTSPAK